MKRELGIARCGLACCLCSENDACPGCREDGCKDKSWCKNRQCSAQRGLEGCWQCPESCREGLLAKSKPYGFTLFLRRYGLERLLDCLERNEENGVVYHREGIVGDYDSFEDPEELAAFILTGKRGAAPMAGGEAGPAPRRAAAREAEDCPLPEGSLSSSLMGRCGFYCGVCPTYVSGSCPGCEAAHGQGDCFTRDCAEKRGLSYCTLCGEFPCPELLRREKVTVLDKGWLRWKKRLLEQME